MAEYFWRAWFAIPFEGRVVLLTLVCAASLALLSRAGEWGSLPISVADSVHAVLVEAQRMHKTASQDEDPAMALQHASEGAGLMRAARLVAGNFGALQSVSGNFDPVALEKSLRVEQDRAWKDLDFA